MTDWILKIMALLHDPPGKILGLEGHQRRAFELMEKVIGTQEFQNRLGRPASQLTRRVFEDTFEGQTIKEADRIASAIDRTAFPGQVRLESADFMNSPQVRHPLTGKALKMHISSGTSTISQDIINFVSAQPDPRRKYLALWRVLPLLSTDPTTRLLPPDTRIVDHFLWTHLDVTSALAVSLPEVAMLQMAIGPVQTFIYEARRTQDLWMGSYLLSYLAWSGIEVIGKAYGPDALIYPSLRGHPWLDRWLKEESVRLPLSVFTGDITIATTPNRFVAILPAQEVEHVGYKVTDAIRCKWQEIAEAVRKEFPGGSKDGIWQKIWKRQVERGDWPEIYWSVVYWPNTNTYKKVQGSEEALKRVESCLGPQPFQRERLNLYRQSWKEGVNVGTMYDALYELLTSAMEARKRNRTFLPTEEDGEKCTVSPSLSALRTAEKQSRSQVRRYWEEVSRALKGQGRVHEVASDGRERLSAIAAIKRFAQRSYFDKRHSISLSFPSTSRVTAVPFYRELFRLLGENEEVEQALQKHLKSLQGLDYPKVSSEAAKGALPGLRKEWEQLANDVRKKAEELLAYEADVLYPERLDPQILEREYAPSNHEAALKAQETCRELYRRVKMAPPTYYAILMMDGDNMGKWLSGKHENMPRFQETMHPNVLPKFDKVDNADNWIKMLQKARPLAANLHASLNTALSTFAWRCVRWVVEERHYGRAVYAGGDDVLALLPLTEALEAARELYALFTGHAEVKNGELQFKEESNGFLEWENEILLMPGPRISLSAGLAVVHHLYPLDAALAAAREAERKAKQVQGKAAMAVTVLKRGGESIAMRSKWLNLGNSFNELRKYFANGLLSSRFAYALSERARVVTALPPDAQKATLRQLIMRHKAKLLSDEEAEKLAERLTQWASALNAQVPPENVGDMAVAGGLAELARWVRFARFVAGGGE